MKRIYITIALFLIGLNAMAQEAYDQVFFERAEKHRMGRNFEEAIAQYNNAIAINDTVANYHFLKGYCQLKLEEYEAASETFSTVIQLNPDHQYGFKALVKAHMMEKNFDEVIKTWDEMSSHADNKTEKVHAKHLIINLLLKMREFDRALLHVESALEIDPNNSETLYLRDQLNIAKTYNTF